MNKVNGDIFQMRLGLPGQGKTLTLVEEVIIPALKAGIDVYVNFWINWTGSNIHYFNEFNEIESVRNCIVVFDEIGRILDPRHWDDEGSGVRNFFQLHRHRHVEIYGTTQHISLIAKSALIEVDSFIMCQKNFNGKIINLLFENFPWIVITEFDMTLKEIKAEESDYIINDHMYDDEFDTGNQKTHWYNRKKLLHLELDSFKEEYVHLYCDLCKKRQGTPIYKNQSDSYIYYEKNKWYIKPDNELILTNCPKHKSEKLQIVRSGMFDSDYDINIVKKEIVFKPFYKALKEVPYKGVLTSSQLELKNKLEKI